VQPGGIGGVEAQTKYGGGLMAEKCRFFPDQECDGPDVTWALDTRCIMCQLLKIREKIK